MTKRRLSDDVAARKRHKPTTGYQPQLSPHTTDTMTRLHNQGIYETVKGIYKESQDLRVAGDAKLHEMLPTSDGRDMKYKDFMPVQHETVYPRTFHEAIVRIRKLERNHMERERLWDVTRMTLKEKLDKKDQEIRDLMMQNNRMNTSWSARMNSLRRLGQ
ncbi:hypothetical protein NXS19_009632 [Fusarium pseudograminearum]|nr:hypothetical protein NXS19_009632 [Fusarium pseudograminearum]